MGVDFYCGETTFGTSYGGWNELIRIVIKSTFDYIQNKFQKDFELYNSITDEEDEHYIAEGTRYNCYKKDIIKIFELMQTASKKPNIFGMNIDTTINDFIDITRHLSYVDALIYFDIGGLYSLCNKNDCEGFYSAGNSFDICHLFDLIKPFIKINNEDTYSAIYSTETRFYGHCLYELFKKSKTQHKKITIA
jgi:hypothetical protein